MVVYGPLGTRLHFSCATVLLVELSFCCLLGGYNKDVVNCDIEFIVKPAIPMFANICKVFFLFVLHKLL